jgi:hypothetical protein
MDGKSLISSTWCVKQEGRVVPPYGVDIERLAEMADVGFRFIDECSATAISVVSKY